MKYAFEMGCGAMIYEYIPSFVKIGSGIQTLMGGYIVRTQRQHGDPISMLLFF
jgi:hypothetical protein